MASTSRYRKELLGRLGLSFSCLAPGVDEAAHPGEAHRDLVARLARAKASAVSVQQPNAWVIGSDQIAALDEGPARLGKPGTAARCQEQLRSCSGRTVEFLTAVALMRADNGALTQAVQEWIAKCDSLQQQIDQYDERRRFDAKFGSRPESVREPMWESWLERSKLVEVAA